MSNARTLASLIDGSNIVVPSGGIAFTDLDSSNNSATANEAYVLGQDGYEQGTWTPVFEGSGGSIGTTAYSERGGRYTKIGNRVILNFTMGLSSTGSWSGNVKITGIPFTGVGSLSGDEALSALEVRNTTISGKYCLLDLGRFSNTYLAPIQITSDATSSAITVSNVAYNGFFRATMVYTAA